MEWMRRTGRINYAAEGGGQGRHRMSRPLVPGIPSRVVDPSGVVKRQEVGPTRAQEPESESEPAPEPDFEQPGGGQLVVGRGIRFKGEIKTCDTLVVHGDVEASLPGRALKVGEVGVYNGTAEVELADIAGSFEGTLTVSGRLTIAATGKIKGTIRYGELAIEAGGQISGDVQVLTEASGSGKSAAGKGRDGARPASDTLAREAARSNA